MAIKIFLGFVLLCMGVAFIGGLAGTAVQAYAVFDPKWRGGMPGPAMAVLCGVTLLMTMFFGRVCWGLISELRGVPAALMPRWIAVALAAIIGLAGVAIAVAGALNGRWNDAGHLGTSAVFLGFAWNTLRRRSGPTNGPPPS